MERQMQQVQGGARRSRDSRRAVPVGDDFGGRCCLTPRSGIGVVSGKLWLLCRLCRWSRSQPPGSDYLAAAASNSAAAGDLNAPTISQCAWLGRVWAGLHLCWRAHVASRARGLARATIPTPPRSPPGTTPRMHRDGLLGSSRPRLGQARRERAGAGFLNPKAYHNGY